MVAVKRPSVIWLSLWLLVFITPAYSGYEVGVAVWESDGETSWNHDASALSSLVGDPTSKLSYKDARSTVLEISWRTDFLERFYFKAAYGIGGINEGELLDDDFVSAQGAAFFGTTVSGAHRISRTLSDIDDGDLSYIDLTLGRELINRRHRGRTLGIFLGWQKWEEKYIAKGLTQLECTAPGVFCNPVGFMGFAGQRVITNEAEWTSVFLGVDGTIRLSKKVEFTGNIAYTPNAKLDNEDIHHLRADLMQDPSFEMSGEGDGWKVQAAVTVQIKKNLATHVGFRYWKLEVEDEDWTSFPVSGPPVNAELNEFSTERTGLFIEIVIGARSGGT